MTFSDIVTVLGVGAGGLLLLGMAAAPLLADLTPNPARGRRRGGVELPTPAPPSGAILSGPAMPVVPAPRDPVDGPSRVPDAGRHLAAG